MLTPPILDRLGDRFYDKACESHSRSCEILAQSLLLLIGLSTISLQVHAINQDTRCQQLLDLLARSRERPMTTTGQQIVYRHACEDIIGHDENLFRLEWIPSAKALGIQLLAPDELTLDDALEQENGEWKYYIDSYALDQATEGLAADAHAPLLQRWGLSMPL